MAHLLVTTPSDSELWVEDPRTLAGQAATLISELIHREFALHFSKDELKALYRSGDEALIQRLLEEYLGATKAQFRRVHMAEGDLAALEYYRASPLSTLYGVQFGEITEEASV